MLRLLTIALILSLPAVARADLFSYAHVQDDASLKIKGQTVHLDGIYIPPTDRDCQTTIRPARCATRAALALEFKIQGFVRCEINSRNEDRSLNGTCYANSTNFDPGEDLAAYLLRKGWAVATPGAPFEYHVLGEIAKERELGIWGFSADRILR